MRASAVATITQDIRFRLSLIHYSEKYQQMEGFLVPSSETSSLVNDTKQCIIKGKTAISLNHLNCLIQKNFCPFAMLKTISLPIPAPE